MGAGSKTRKYTLNKKPEPFCSFNGSTTARNIRKRDLGGVIFGCKHNTYKECFSKQLFGLPAPHFSYVRNIHPGLTLFLFNYSDRTLHGIFEAASHGQLNIDPSAWTADGLECTPYAAQVRFQVRMQCQPVLEKQFRPIIADNYYEPRLFWFELDQSQAEKLILLLSSSSQNANSSNLSKTFPNPRVIEEGDCKQASDLKEVVANPDFSKSKCTSTSQRKWCGLFNDGTTSHESKKVEDFKTSTSEISSHHAAKVTIGGECPYFAPCSHERGNFLEDPLNREQLDKYDESLHLENVNTGWSSSSMVPCLDKENRLEEVSWNESLLLKLEELKLSQSKQLQKIHSLEQELAKAKEEIQQLKSSCVMLQAGSSPIPREVEVEESLSINKHHPNLGGSILIVGGFDGSSWLSTLDSYYPSHDVMRCLGEMSFMRSHASAAKLNGQLYLLGGVYNNVWYDTVESYDLMTSQWFRHPSLRQKKACLVGISLNEKMFAIGGGNGVQSFSEVEMLDVGIGRWIGTSSMLHGRFSSDAAEINGVLYVVGGYDGQNYLNSVERFDYREHSWAKVGSMATRRACHSLVVLNEKLHAIGGYNGDRMVPTTEIFDPRAGRWMMGTSLNHSRGYCDAVVIEDAVYAIGGFKDNESLLETVELYRQGHSWQVTDLKGIGKRCFFSAVVI